jgi:hypothetical protein
MTEISHIAKKLEDMERKIETNHENLVQQISALGSDQKAANKEFQDFKEEMKPWLEAKIGLGLLWRWFIAVPTVVVALYFIKEMFGWINITK